jgi:hypothetical protein
VPDILLGFGLGLGVAIVAVALAAWSIQPRVDGFDEEGDPR